MNNYITGSAIRTLREKNHLTQQQLAEKLCVSDKAISKWETGKGFPDISLIEPLANVLQVSIPELLSGEQIINNNRSANISKSNLYVCPICGNIFHSTGSAMISCCGITLPPLEAEQANEEHQIKCEKIEDEFFISMQHPMTKEHYISFVVYCTGERFESVKLYPESSIEVRFFSRGHGTLYWYSFIATSEELSWESVSNVEAAKGAISVGNVYNLELLGGASACPGDYLYRSGSLRWDVESGMWGILRVKMRTLFYTVASCCRNVGQWWEKAWKKEQ